MPQPPGGPTGPESGSGGPGFGTPPGPGFAQPTTPLPGLPDPFPSTTESGGIGAPLPGIPDPFASASESGGMGVPSPGETPGGTTEPPRTMRGSIERQEAGVTQPRPPTVAEARARDKARKRAEEAERAAAEALEQKKRTRKRMLIGGVAVVGIAAVVGAGYLTYRAVTAPDEVTASCITDDNGQQTVVPDDECERAQQYATTSGGGYYGGGGFPGFFIYNGHQYRYYYGGNNTVGRPPTGGSTVAPKSATVKTKSGTVVRGGLGSKSSSTSGGS
ncbi:nucleoid-associated protein YgaU [Nocardia transvalensis]|uniref:Nucleoid-associated protein YgaU n=1 Tax=Nocardia transvalensis TaxID=37333 RepID=A0A7W9P9J6_9NOCA|nr:hypothetical protein [Nocardia transvalensis]MBB5911639.1 nucleoid-associated protein YgaU [Nocardia transvalensis]